MGRFGRGDDDAPRVVGFDFGAPPPAPAAYVPDESTPPPAPPPTPPVTEYAAPPVYATAPAYEPSYASPVQTAVAPPPMPMAYVPPGYAMPQPMPAPVTLTRTRSGIRRELTILGVLLGVIAALGVVQQVRRPDDTDAPAVAQGVAAPPSLAPLLEDLNAPPTVGGERRMSTYYSRAMARAIRKELLQTKARHSEIETYGNGRHYPTYMLIAGDLTPGNAQRVFDYYLRGRVRASWGAQRAYPGNVRCGRYDAGTTHGSVCLWASKVSDGVVIGYTQRDPARLARVTVQARRDLERGR